MSHTVKKLLTVFALVTMLSAQGSEKEAKAKRTWAQWKSEKYDNLLNGTKTGKKVDHKFKAVKKHKEEANKKYYTAKVANIQNSSLSRVTINHNEEYTVNAEDTVSLEIDDKIYETPAYKVFEITTKKDEIIALNRERITAGILALALWYGKDTIYNGASSLYTSAVTKIWGTPAQQAADQENN
jgi:hypothetical protein